MTRRLTDGQRKAIAEVRALALTALHVADATAARGEESDERPRAYVEALARWTLGAETGPQLAVRTRAMERWRDATFDALPKPAGLDADPWGDALHWLADARADLMRNPYHTHHAPRVLRSLALTLRRVDGDAPEAANARVQNALAECRRRVDREIADARREAALAAKLKDDKAAAELVLGTAQETGR